MEGFVRALMRPPAVIALGVGVALAVFGAPVFGTLAVLVGLGLGWRSSRSVEALLGEALRGLSVIMDPQVRAQLGDLIPALRQARMAAGIQCLGTPVTPVIRITFCLGQFIDPVQSAFPILVGDRGAYPPLADIGVRRLFRYAGHPQGGIGMVAQGA